MRDRRRRQPNTWFDDDQLESLRAGGNDDWKTREFLPDVWKHLPEWLGGSDTIGLYTSGSSDTPRPEGDQQAIMGIDRAKHETRPVKGEPELNSYHWFVSPKTLNPSTGEMAYPVYGPIKGRDTRVPHWHDLEELVEAYPLDGTHSDDPGTKPRPKANSGHETQSLQDEAGSK